MGKIPQSGYQKVSFRSPTSSEEHNKRAEETFDDIMSLFSMANELESGLEESKKAFEMTGRFQHVHTLNLEHEIDKLKSEVKRLKSGETMRTIHLFVEDMKEDPTAASYEKAYIDTGHQVVTLPITGKSISKVYIYDEVAKEIRIPEALKVEVLPKERSGWKIEENSPKEATNGDNHRFWHRKVTMPLDETPAGPVQAEMTITLPDTIISNRDVNTVYIKTFPVNSLQIDKVEYRLEGDWALLPGWETDENGMPAPKEYAGNLKLCFGTMGIAELRVTMTQNHWFEEDNQKVYHFGLQEVGVFHVDYQSETGRFDIGMTLERGNGSNAIHSIKPVFKNRDALSANDDTISSVFTYRIYTVDEYGQTHYTKDVLPTLVTEEKIIIRGAIHMDPYTKVTPVLERIDLTYENV